MAIELANSLTAQLNLPCPYCAKPLVRTMYKGYWYCFTCNTFLTNQIEITTVGSEWRLSKCHAPEPAWSE